jgi:isopenicillin N synthase-like dioxygenase
MEGLHKGGHVPRHAEHVVVAPVPHVRVQGTQCCREDGSHQDTNLLCRHEVEGLEVQTKDGEWILPVKPSLVVMAGNTLWVSAMTATLSSLF